MSSVFAINYTKNKKVKKKYIKEKNQYRITINGDLQ